jgi:peroxiredoxin
VGAQAPPFTLPARGGGKLSAPEPGRLTCLVFYKASCPTCRWALPFFGELHERTKGGALSIVGVAQDTPEEAETFAAELGLGFPIAVEPEPWSTSARYELKTVPTTFLVDGEGRVLVKSAGFSRDDLHEVARRAAEADGAEPADPFAGASVPAFRPG